MASYAVLNDQTKLEYLRNYYIRQIKKTHASLIDIRSTEALMCKYIIITR